MRFEEIPESDPETVITKLLSNAQENVWMSSKIHPNFYNRPMVKEALEKSINKVMQFQLLLDASVDWEQRKKELPWLDELLRSKRFSVRKSAKPILHWLIIDGANFRLEKPHKDELLASNMIIWDASKPISDMLRAEFNDWWLKAVTV